MQQQQTGNYFDKYDDIPETASAPTADSNYFDRYDEEPEEAMALAPAETSWLQRTEDSLNEMKTDISDALEGKDASYDTSNIPQEQQEALGDPTYSPAQVASTVASEVLTTGSNILVDGGLSLLDTLMPDTWQDAVVNFSRDRWDEISQNPTMRKGLEAAKSGLEAYDEWAKENPEAAKRLGESVSIGSLGRGKGPKRGETYIKRQKKHNINNRKNQTKDMLEPDTKDFGKYDYYEDNRGTIVWDPKTWTREVIDEVVRVPEVKPRKSYVHNMNAVRAHSQSFKTQLDEIVSTKGKPDININSVKTGLANRVNALDKETLLTGEPLSKALKIYDKTARLLDESDGSALGVLNVRRKLDEWVNSQSKVFDADLNTATSIALKDIRSYLNDTVKKNTRSTQVSKLLDKQNKLLTAGDMLETNAMRQADEWFGRLIQKVEKSTGVHLPSTPLAQIATVGFAGTAFGPVGIGAGLSGIAGYQGIKWLFSPDGKMALAQLAKLSDSIPQLKPEVNALIQISQGLQPEVEEEESVE